jgi:hypothetical protein
MGMESVQGRSADAERPETVLQKSFSKPDGWGTKKVENLAASRISDERDA